jgi:hypothetical protein
MVHERAMMGFKKFQKSESVENVNEEEQKVIDGHLQRTAKGSVSEMTDEEKNDLNADLNKENDNA